MMMRAKVLATFLAVGLLLAACGGDDNEAPEEGSGEQQTGELTKVTFLIDFFPSGDHAFFYSAIEEGFFEEEGLDVEIQSVVGGPEVIRSLVAGQVEFGYPDFGTVAIANQDQDAGLKAVMGILQQSPVGTMSPASKNITEPQDLVGKDVLDFAGSTPNVVWPVFLQENGLNADDINLKLVDPATRLSLVAQGRADASMGFWTDNEPPLRDICQCDVNVIKWKDWGITSLSNGIVVTNEYLEENPEVVEAFVNAVVKGVEFTRDNPEAAVDDVISQVGEEDLGSPRDVILAEALNNLTLLTSPAGGGTPTGYMTDEDWQATVDLMVETGQMSEPEDISAFYTNEFIPGAP